MLVLHNLETGEQVSTTQTEVATLARADVAMHAPRILLADDHEEMLETLAGILEDEFQIVGTANNGMRALELAASLMPDIVVLDISMPEVNGIEAAWRLREEGSLARVVFVTAHNDPDLVEAATIYTLIFWLSSGLFVSGGFGKAEAAVIGMPAVGSLVVAATEDEVVGRGDGPVAASFGELDIAAEPVRVGHAQRSFRAVQLEMRYPLNAIAGVCHMKKKTGMKPGPKKK